MNETAWMSKALCKGMNPDVFVPATEPRVPRTVELVCGACPVQTDCLEYALHFKLEGFWGGATTAERKRLRAERGIKAAPAMPSQSCGRAAGYREHLRNGEPACQACLAAEARRSWERNRKRQREDVA